MRMKKRPIEIPPEARKWPLVTETGKPIDAAMPKPILKWIWSFFVP